MTLHWWMHWFWVTLFLLLNVVAGNPLPTSSASTSPYTPGSVTTASLLSEEDSSRQNYRVAKAIGASDSSGIISDVNDKGSVKNSVLKKSEDSRAKESNGTVDTTSRTNADSKITWIFNANRTSRTGVSVAETEKFVVDEYKRNSSSEGVDDPLAVLPLNEATPTRFKLVLNRTKFIPSTNLNNNSQDRVLNRSELDVEISERDDLGDSLLATAASISQGINDSPRLSRARSASPGDYQQDEQQEIRQERKQEKADNFRNSTSTAVDIAAVTGSCLATIVLLATMGSLGFVMYRRRYLNPPQTLNSDKCSNPDSSGYIDDSTIRDNSEEMYSLDNDSFLNSLEAMTIQNYWTDSVKHTKL